MGKKPELIDTRIISGKGVIAVPLEKRAARKFWLYADIIRLPLKNYVNNKYPRQRSDYCNLLWIEDDYVVREETMHYDRQQWSWNADIVAQLMYETQCSFIVTNKNLKTVAEALGAFAGLSPFEPTHPLANHVDKVIIECRDDTAVSLRLYIQDYDFCPDQQASPSAGIEPPGKPPRQPAGVPLIPGQSGYTVSPPYPFEEEGDGALTQPYPIDILDEPPVPPGACPVRSFIMVWEGNATFANGQTVVIAQRSIVTPGYPTEIYTKGNGSLYYRFISGCEPTTYSEATIFNGGDYATISATIVSVTPA